MKKRMLVILVLITLLMGGIASQAAFAADEDRSRLTADEQRFIEIQGAKNALATAALANARNFIEGGYESGNINIDGLEFNTCRWDAIKAEEFVNIGPLWNKQVCDQLAYLNTKLDVYITAQKDPDADLAPLDLMDQLLLSTTIKEVDASINMIESKVHAHAAELEKERRLKEEKEEAERKRAAGATSREPTSSDDGFCFIATAAYGTPAAKEIDVLRQFRDDFLRESSLGNGFIDFYYRTSPPLADFIAEHETLRTVIREGLVDPVVAVVELTRKGWDK
ncbi:CFI-box-CTERM domain-containing protein [Chloroflexota bacterium]